MTTDEERRAKQAEYMRKWRAANPERTREIARRSMEKWRQEHPEESRDYFQKWKADNPDKVKATWQRAAAKMKTQREADPEPFRERDRGYRARYLAKWAGMPESTMHDRFAAANPAAISMDKVRPDFYVPGEGFVEIKRALPHSGICPRVTLEGRQGIEDTPAQLRHRIESSLCHVQQVPADLNEVALFRTRGLTAPNTPRRHDVVLPTPYRKVS